MDGARLVCKSFPYIYQQPISRLNTITISWDMLFRNHSPTTVNNQSFISALHSLLATHRIFA